MQQLIEDLLAYARVKNISDHFEKTDLDEIALEVIADFKDQIVDKKAIVKTVGLCSANIIRFQMRQLMHNLIGNSIKFADTKRTLRIDIKCTKALGSKLKNRDLLPETKYCHLTFRDNGMGFDSKYKDRIFEVFQRLNDYTAFNGTGIGLAICKRVVENHQGFITANAVLGGGATFDIYIPAA